jgi:hypothetical protein
LSQDSGFVAIRFHLAGKILLVMGIIGLLAAGVDLVTGWFSLPAAIPVLCIFFTLVGLYLIFIVPREPEENA